MGIKVLGKDSDSLHGADTAALLELLEKQMAIPHFSDEGAEGSGLFKGHSTPKWHRVGAVNCVLMLSCHTLQMDPFPKIRAMPPVHTQYL